MSFRRLKREDVPGAPPWFDAFLSEYNSLVDFLQGAFDGGIRLGVNVQGEMKELQIRTQADYTSGEFDVVKFRTRLDRVQDVKVMQVIDLDDQNTPLSGSFGVQWRASNGEVKVMWIEGLAPSARYSVRFHCW